MSFYLMRTIIEVSLSLHFFLRLKAGFVGFFWQLPVLLWLALTLSPHYLQKWLSHYPPAIDKYLAQVTPALNEFQSSVTPMWMGFLIIFTVTCLGLDVIRLTAGLVGQIADKSWWGFLPAKKAVPVALIMGLAFSVHAYYSAYHPRLVRVEFPTAKLPAGVDSLRIVQLTDVHLSDLITLKDLKRVAALVREAKPDILVVTGDLVDTDMRQRGEEAALLASVRPRYGTFGVYGNHERYRGEANSRDFYRQAGIKVLRGEAVSAGGIIVAGMDDEAFDVNGGRTPPGKLLRQFNRDQRFILFLKHRPNLAPGTAGLFDLQLSGHTHGGQIWPGHLIIKKVNGALHGLDYDGLSKSAVYTSRGSGFWGLPMRFLAPPEVTLIELVRLPE